MTDPDHPTEAVQPAPHPAPIPVTDPANRWATEHYGFGDDGSGDRSDDGPAADVPSSPGRAAGTRPPRRGLGAATLAAGMLSLGVLTGGGAAAVVSRGGDVPAVLSSVTGRQHDGGRFDAAGDGSRDGRR